ncbi:hypothetical protein OG205_33635 [Lentzea sp. NBC_00516]|uniref:hypothetical protein n=1 Tax=Lentzea sp. NBC_00516 TaxID=2903582 RepID=UPI002E80D0CA|nr:hypothetical protein [Lentzea sp. NBC_00516]WUD22980.1 hypothetical protein OG205_33635 [Lentzea sp. NBC_00516]
MKNVFAVTLTAALVLAATGAPAFAQDETITVEGLVYLDRNANRTFDAGDSIRANGVGVRVTNTDTNETVGDFGTGADGRYRAVLPKGPTYSVAIWELEYSFNRVSYDSVTESRTDADFNLLGHVVTGTSFVDTNGDGVKQAGEKSHQGGIKASGKASGGRAVELETQAGEDGTYSLDLPNGEFTVTAPDLTANGLTLAEPKTADDIDWLTGSRKIQQMLDNRTHRVDLRYVEAKADMALASAITPVKDTYTLGDQIDLKLTLSNKGNAPVAPTFVLGSFSAKLLSHSDNVTLRPGTDEDFTVNDKILPGKQIEVALKIELNDVTYTEVHAMTRFSFGRLPDVDRKNNVVSTPIKVAEKSTATPTTTETTAAPTTTTTPAVAKAGNKSGLASTGASPLGFLGLGSLLLAAGLGAFFMARRRRS